FADAKQLTSRTVLSSHLRDLAYRRISIQLLIHKSEQLVTREAISSDSVTGFVDALDLLRMRHQTRSLGEWMELIFDWLARLGWPGTRALDSVEYQQLN